MVDVKMLLIMSMSISNYIAHIAHISQSHRVSVMRSMQLMSLKRLKLRRKVASVDVRILQIATELQVVEPAMVRRLSS